MAVYSARMAVYSAARLDLSMLLPGATNALLKLIINVISPRVKYQLIYNPWDCWANLAALDLLCQTGQARHLVTKASSQTFVACHSIFRCYNSPASRSHPFVVVVGSFPGSSQGSSLVVVLVLGLANFVMSCCS
jgi:hypothetical protein